MSQEDTISFMGVIVPHLKHLMNSLNLNVLSNTHFDIASA